MTRHNVIFRLGVACLTMALLTVSVRSSHGDDASKASSSIKQESPFEKAYSFYRSGKYEAARDQLQDILSDKSSPDSLALKYRIESMQAVEQNLKKAKADPENFLSITSELMDTLRQSYQKMDAHAKKHPNSSVSYEVLGESANELSGWLSDLYVPLLRKADREASTIERESKDLKAAAIRAYQKCVDLDSQHAVAYVRLVANLGSLKTSRAGELLLKAVEVAPGDPQSIQALTITMWQSTLLDTPKQAVRTQIALNNVTGEALNKLRSQKLELNQELQGLRANIENAAAAGVNSAELNRSLERLSKTLSIIDTALRKASTD